MKTVQTSFLAVATALTFLGTAAYAESNRNEGHDPYVYPWQIGGSIAPNGMDQRVRASSCEYDVQDMDVHGHVTGSHKVNGCQ